VQRDAATGALSPTTGNDSSLARLLGAEGPFAGRLDSFAPRQEQIELAEAVADALADGGQLVAEAGTGTGKTLAYLVPVLLSGLRTIISTGTKNLQDQLFFRDLPMVRDALGSEAQIALLKGRSNYLCIQRMEQGQARGEYPSRAAAAEMQAVVDWSVRTPDGDLSVSEVVSDDSGLWPLVTSTPDNCLGSTCPHFEACWVLKARRKAQEADVVVVNHHLLFADMAIRQGGFGEVLPGAEAFIVDEAHQAPETASRFFSSSLSARQITDLLADILQEAGELSGGLVNVREAVSECETSLLALRAVMEARLDERGSWPRLLEHEDIRLALQRLDQAVYDLGPALAPLEGRSVGADGCIERRAALQAQFDQLDAPAGNGEVRWFERRGRGFGLNVTPLDISGLFSRHRDALDAAWVFTSATLAVNGDFTHFTRQMGLQDAHTLCLQSPFDYQRNALLWLPEIPAAPRDPNYIAQLLDAVVPVLEASQGRAFLLFTSHRALRDCATALAARLDFPLFIQGEAPRSLLLERFRRSGNGVLLGTASFWEGVDVMGEALSVVVIDKLPFAAPDDPVLEARSELLRSEGGNPFMDLSLPQAVIALKQGAGRLIRDVHDRGVLVLCDPRLRSRGYGPVFLDSLPPMRRAQARAEVLQFFEPQQIQSKVHETAGH
jgi:ATP-dependent DNA helicase DinG